MRSSPAPIGRWPAWRRRIWPTRWPGIRGSGTGPEPPQRAGLMRVKAPRPAGHGRSRPEFRARPRPGSRRWRAGTGLTRSGSGTSTWCARPGAAERSWWPCSGSGWATTRAPSGTWCGASSGRSTRSGCGSCWNPERETGRERAGEHRMSAVTTHVLDTARGVPAAGVLVWLEQVSGAGRTEIARTRTGYDGRAPGLGPQKLPPGTYRLAFDTAEHSARLRAASDVAASHGAATEGAASHDSGSNAGRCHGATRPGAFPPDRSLTLTARTPHLAAA